MTSKSSYWINGACDAEDSCHSAVPPPDGVGRYEASIASYLLRRHDKQEVLLQLKTWLLKIGNTKLIVLLRTRHLLDSLMVSFLFGFSFLLVQKRNKKGHRKTIYSPFCGGSLIGLLCYCEFSWTILLLCACTEESIIMVIRCLLRRHDKTMFGIRSWALRFLASVRYRAFVILRDEASIVSCLLRRHDKQEFQLNK